MDNNDTQVKDKKLIEIKKLLNNISDKNMKHSLL